MTEQAAPAPAAPQPNGAASQPAAAPPASQQIHAGADFAEFQAQIAERQKQRVNQPPAPPKTVQPQAKQPEAPPGQTLEDPGPQKTLDQVPVEEVDPNAPPAELEQQQAAPAISKEDLELLEKFKAWQRGEAFPEELLAKLPVPLKNGEDVEYETFEEVKAQRMRQRDYTRNMQALDKERAQYKEHLGFYEGHFQAIFSDENDGAAGGDAMYDIYTRAGKHKQLAALGQRLAREEQEDIDGANGAGYAVLQRLKQREPNVKGNDYRVQEAVNKEFERRKALRQSEARGRSLEMENQRLKQQTDQRQQQEQGAEQAQMQRKALEQLRPRAFEALGLNHENPKHRQHFDTYLHAIIRQENHQKVSPELVMKAARAALEEIREEQRGGGGQTRGAPPQQRTFQPQLGAGGGKIPGTQPQQWHAESFAERFKLPSW
jgi:hypothetical protein